LRELRITGNPITPTSIPEVVRQLPNLTIYE
jgi:hypothetical protein